MSDSIWDDPTITAYVLGELADAERDEFESRLESNSELAAAVEEVRSVTGQLEGLYATEPTATLDTERRESILSGETDAALRVEDSYSWKVPMLIAATAAAILLLVGIGPWLKQQELEFTVSQREETADDGFALEAARSESELEAPQELLAEAKIRQILEQAPVHSPGVSLPPVSGERPVSLQRDSEIESLGRAAAPRFVKPSPTESRRLDTGARVNMPRGSTGAQLDAERRFNTSSPRPEKAQLSAADAETAHSDDLSQVIADTPVEFVPELGAIVLSGSIRDVANVKKVIDEVQLSEQLEGKSSDAKADRWAVSPTPAPVARAESRLKYGAAAEPVSPLAQHLDVAKTESKKPSDAFFRETNAPTPVVRGRMAKEAEVTRLHLVPQPSTAAGRGGIAGGGRVELGFRLKSADLIAPHDEGRGPGIAGDRFDPITDNPFKRVMEHPLSTFSVDVDTASYSKTRDVLMRAGKLPRPDAVRIEELINYFDYEYDPPSAGDKHPFAARATVTSCPWNKEHRLARIALKGKTMGRDERPTCNLVFLIDTSGSMKAANKLPLVIEGMKMLVDQLGEHDRVAIAVYADAAGLVLDSVRAKKSKKIHKALERLSSGGSTNGGAGIALAYHAARENFITEGVNRVILCTDGDFNVGLTGTDALVRMVAQEAKEDIFLSVLGFGMGNHNDAMLEKISGRGNGNYAFIDSKNEARKVLVDQTSGTLVTIAKDVKLQIKFNPTHVSSYRLIGYENRVLAKEDFKNDKIDAGEIGAGHAVTALYEIVPAGVETDASAPEVDDLKYLRLEKTEAADSDEMMTLMLRYKQPDGDTSTKVEFPVTDEGGDFAQADHDLRFAAAVAGFGMQLRRSDYAGNWTLSDVLKVAEDAKGEDEYGLRAEFVELVNKASELMGQQ